MKKVFFTIEQTQNSTKMKLMENKQTAVEWFANKLGITSGTMLEQANKIFEQQIIDAYQAGDGDAYNLKETEDWAKEYYIETYGNKGSDETKTDKI